MTVSALQWYHWLSTNNQLSTWATFTCQAKLRLGPSRFINHEARLFKLKQRTTMDAYLNEFEALSTHVTKLSDTSLLNYFLSGLSDNIQSELYLLHPESLHDAIGMAKLLEDKCHTTRIY